MVVTYTSFIWSMPTPFFFFLKKINVTYIHIVRQVVVIFSLGNIYGTSDWVHTVCIYHVLKQLYIKNESTHVIVMYLYCAHGLDRHGQYWQQCSGDDLRQFPHSQSAATQRQLGSDILGAGPGQWQHQQFIVWFAGLLLLQRLSQGRGWGQGQEHWHQQVNSDLLLIRSPRRVNW